jgi:hypothetical protein
LENDFELVFSAFINKSYLDDLQEILFFNPHQKKYKNKIINAIHLCGKPEVIEENNLITIQLDKNQLQQTLFVLDKSEDKRLLALIIFKKESDVVEVIHLAFAPFCKDIFINENISIFNQTIIQFSKMLSHFKEIKFIKFHYKNLKINIDKVRNWK